MNQKIFSIISRHRQKLFV